MGKPKDKTEKTEARRAGPDRTQEEHADAFDDVAGDDAGPVVHPAAGVFPMMSDDELRALADDIKTNGQHEPITRNKATGQIVDGRNRLAACEMAGVEPNFEDKAFEDTAAVVRFVISSNIHRRHLNPSQIAMVAARMVTTDVSGGRPEKTEPIGPVSVSRKEAAQMTGAAVKSISRARKVLQTGDTDLIGKVERGEIKLNKALSEINGKKPKPPKSPPKKPEAAAPDQGSLFDDEDDPRDAFMQLAREVIAKLIEGVQAKEEWPVAALEALGGEERLRAAVSALDKGRSAA